MWLIAAIAVLVVLLLLGGWVVDRRDGRGGHRPGKYRDIARSVREEKRDAHASADPVVGMLLDNSWRESHRRNRG